MNNCIKVSYLRTQPFEAELAPDDGVLVGVAHQGVAQDSALVIDGVQQQSARSGISVSRITTIR